MILENPGVEYEGERPRERDTDEDFFVWNRHDELEEILAVDEEGREEEDNEENSTKKEGYPGQEFTSEVQSERLSVTFGQEEPEQNEREKEWEEDDGDVFGEDGEREGNSGEDEVWSGVIF